MKKNKLSRRIKAAISFMLCSAVLVCASPSRNVEAKTSSSIQSIESKLEQIEQQQKEYEQKLDELSAAETSALEKKSYFDKQVQLTQDKINSTQELISQYDALINEKISEIDGKESEIDVKFDEFLERFALNYEDGFVNYLVLIFDSESFTDFLMNTERTADILEYDRTLMNNLENEKSDLEAKKKELEEARTAQQEAKKSLEETKSGLQTQLSQQEGYIASLESDTAKYESLLKEAQAADAALNAELEAALAAAANDEYVQYSVDQGQLIWPVSTSYSTVSSAFGWRTLFGSSDFHYGIDIPAPYGSNVYASQSGTVTHAQSHYSYGNFIVINHGGGYSTLYAHNSSICVSVGQTVKRGDVIAYVGATGIATGSHCHFEVRKNGAVQNPMSYLTQP